MREILEEALPYLNIYQDETPAKGALTPEETNFYTGLNGVTVPATTAEPQEQGGEEQQETEPETGEAPEGEQPDEPETGQ